MNKSINRKVFWFLVWMFVASTTVFGQQDVNQILKDYSTEISIRIKNLTDQYNYSGGSTKYHVSPQISIDGDILLIDYSYYREANKTYTYVDGKHTVLETKAGIEKHQLKVNMKQAILEQSGSKTSAEIWITSTTGGIEQLVVKPNGEEKKSLIDRIVIATNSFSLKTRLYSAISEIYKPARQTTSPQSQPKPQIQIQQHTQIPVNKQKMAFGYSISAPGTMQRSYSADHDYIYIYETAPVGSDYSIGYKVLVSELPMAYSRMISSDQAQIARNLKTYLGGKGQYATKSVNVACHFSYSVNYTESGYSVRECVILTDKYVIELIVGSKKAAIATEFSRFVSSFVKE